MIRTIIGTVIGILTALVVLQKFQQATHEQAMGNYVDAAALNRAYADIQTIKINIKLHWEKTGTLPCSVDDLPFSLRVEGQPLSSNLLAVTVPACGVIEFPLAKSINGREPVIRYQLTEEVDANRTVLDWQCEVNVKTNIVDAQIPCVYHDPTAIVEESRSNY